MSIIDQMAQDAGIQNTAKPSILELMAQDAQAINDPPNANFNPNQSSTFEDVKGALASGPISAYVGAKQALGLGSEFDKSILQQNKEAAMKAPTTAVLGNLAMLAPTALIPGANTYSGASVIGALNGLIQPADNLKERGLNVGIGSAGGAVGQKLGNLIGGYLGSKLGNAQVSADTINALNVPKQEILKSGQDAGFVIPPSSVNPTWIGNRLESLAGKAAIKQESAIRNQQVTNDLARKSLGLAEDVPLSTTALDGIRKEAGSVYQEVGKLSPIAKQDLEALKQSRNDAQGWFNAYNRSASPADLAKAKEARDLSDLLEKSLEDEAKNAGRSELIPALRDARVQIAKTYTVQRALNDATGDISAPVIGRLTAKGKPLTDELKIVGQFQNAFPQFMGAAAKTPAAGVGKTELLAAALLGGAGMHETDSPYGAAAAGLAFLSAPARAALLSKMAQGSMAKIPEAVTPKSLRLAEMLMNNNLTKGAMPALTAQGVLSSASGYQ